MRWTARGCVRRSASPGGGRLPDEVIDELLAGASTGEEIVGSGGLLAQLTKRLVERALEVELTEHLGYEPQARAARVDRVSVVARVNGAPLYSDPRPAPPRPHGTSPPIARARRSVSGTNGSVGQYTAINISSGYRPLSRTCRITCATTTPTARCSFSPAGHPRFSGRDSSPRVAGCPCQSAKAWPVSISASAISFQAAWPVAAADLVRTGRIGRRAGVAARWGERGPPRELPRS